MKKTLYLFIGALLITQTVTASEPMINMTAYLHLGGSRGPNPIVYNEMAMAQQRQQQEQAIAREQEDRTRREREAREGHDRAVESARVERERVEQIIRAENQASHQRLTFELRAVEQSQILYRDYYTE